MRAAGAWFLWSHCWLLVACLSHVLRLQRMLCVVARRHRPVEGVTFPRSSEFPGYRVSYVPALPVREVSPGALKVRNGGTYSMRVGCGMCLVPEEPKLVLGDLDPHVVQTPTHRPW